jgi:Swi5-dependent recombination DNA repair protein 1
MLTPAAKKRRVDAANAQLRKPFRSPLIKRAIAPSPSQGSSAGAPSTPLKYAESSSAIEPVSPVVSSAERLHKSTTAAVGPQSRPKGGKTKLELLVTVLENELRLVERQILEEGEVVRQAERIRMESEGKRPGEEIDVELKELCKKWKAASRLAAEEVFEVVKERVTK